MAPGAEAKEVRAGFRPCLAGAILCCLLSMPVAIAAAPAVLAAGRAGQAEPARKVYQVGREVSAPVLTRQVDPEYPATLRKEGKFSGSCEVALIVDAAGNPQDVHLSRSLNEAMDKNAILAVKQYRFKPAMYQGKPVPVHMKVEVNFQMF